MKPRIALPSAIVSRPTRIAPIVATRMVKWLSALRHPFRRVYERQSSDALAGAALARGARSRVRQPEPIRCHHTLSRGDDDLTLTSDRGAGETYCNQRKNPTYDDCRAPLYGPFVKMDGS